MITLFTVPKPFEGEFDRLQRNAIGSWLQMRPRPEVMLLGSDAGVGEVASEFGIQHVRPIATTPAGTPLVDDAFRRAESLATSPLLAYVNCDIVLFQDFAEAVHRVVRHQQHFLMVGRRTDLDFEGALHFDAGWADRFSRTAKEEGVVHSEAGIDYFVFPRGLWTDIPPFAVGRFAWDGWLLWAARESGATVVDATRSVLAVHQNHSYPGPPGVDGEGVWHDEIRCNLSLAGPYAGSFTIRDSDRVLTRGGWLVPALAPRHLRRRAFRAGQEARARGPWVLRIVLRVADTLRSWRAARRSAT